MSLNDRYNKYPNYNERSGREGTHYSHERRTEINFTPQPEELLSTYIARTAQAIQQLDDKAWKQHVEGNREWFCHRNLMGCFICQHTQFLYILRNSFKALGNTVDLTQYHFVFDQETGNETNHPRWTIKPTNTPT